MDFPCRRQGPMAHLLKLQSDAHLLEADRSRHESAYHQSAGVVVFLRAPEDVPGPAVARRGSGAALGRGGAIASREHLEEGQRQRLDAAAHRGAAPSGDWTGRMNQEYNERPLQQLSTKTGTTSVPVLATFLEKPISIPRLTTWRLYLTRTALRQIVRAAVHRRLRGRPRGTGEEIDRFH